MSHFAGLNGKSCSRAGYPTAPTGLIDAQIGEHAFAGRRRKGPEDAERVRMEGAARDDDSPATSSRYSLEARAARRSRLASVALASASTMSGKAIGQVIARTAVELRPLVVLTGYDPKPVVLDFVQPDGAGGRLRG
jgi:hypothetical protein